MNLIASWQLEIKEEDRVFQVWELKQMQTKGWLVLCTDGNNRELCRQELVYSNFPLSSITVWLVDDILMLPGEY
jgi:hypothetical protein